MAKISNLTELTTATDTSEIVINDGTPTTKKITIANLKTSLGVNYTKLVCLISQSGTDAPTLTILENTLGDTPSLAYNGVGDYQMVFSTLSIDYAKTFLTIGSGNFTDSNVRFFGSSSTTLRLSSTRSHVETDGVLNITALEIRIYE